MLAVEQHILRATVSREPVLAEAASGLVASGGKRLRPAFVLMGGQFGGTREPALAQIAAGVELLHMATLVHDDIIDDAPLRRGAPTVQARYGKDVAVFTGDFLLTKALLLMAEADVDQRLKDLARAMTAVCEGEVAQYADRFKVPGMLRYLRRIRGKTAALFSLSLYAGARQCKAPDSTCKCLARYGLFFGMAFQIEDDVLDYMSGENQLGKPAGYDLVSGIYTLPLLYALQDSTAHAVLEQLLSAGGETPVARIVEAVRGTDALPRARNMRDRYVNKAIAALDVLPQSPAREALRDLPWQIFADPAPAR
jgi:heptaprenyl diphosphate synthase